MEEEVGRRKFFHPGLFGAITITVIGILVVFSIGHTDVLGAQKKVLAVFQAPTPTPTLTPTSTPSPTPSPSPSPTPTPSPTVTPTPTITPTPFPTANPEDTANWDKLAGCETHGNWGEDTGNGYFGGLQFSQSAWTAVGGSGKPSDASRDEQILRAKTLFSHQGWGAWGECAKRVGLY